ncbi:sigma-70 family RNA polymerase sigma factor [Streptomyces sp. T-3]|nr:sigma-70 family RNA polymerase sigma factor [Streptomyces sp. T-3]
MADPVVHAQDDEALAHAFQEHRSHLRSVAYRMLGSLSEADDAIQDAWFKVSRADSASVANLGGWFTTIVGRVCLDMLRTRKTRREAQLEGPDGQIHVPDPIVGRAEVIDPEHEVMLADSVGLALLVVLETLQPAERLAFVLHDMFGVSFDDIALIVDRNPAAARKLASRARTRVQGAAPAPDTDLTRKRAIVDAWLAASQNGDFEALVSMLDPDVVLRADGGTDLAGVTKLIRGVQAVVEQAMMFARYAQYGHVVLINGAAGMVTAPEGKVFSITEFTVRDGLIVEINILADPSRIAGLPLPELGD